MPSGENFNSDPNPQSEENGYEAMAREVAEDRAREDQEASAREAVENAAREAAERINNMSLDELMEYQAANEDEKAIQISAIKAYYDQMPDNPSSAESLTDREALQGRGKEAEKVKAAVEDVETAKGKEGFKKWIKDGAKKWIALALAVGIAIGSFVGAAIASRGQEQAPVDTGNQTETNIEDEKNGIKDGYGEKGMYLSDNKPSELAFGSAVEVADIFDGDECEMVKYTADNQVEAMASYIAHMPKELQPDGFQGLTIVEAEKKLESLSDEDYEKVQTQFNEAIDKAFTRNVKLDGTYDNVYMDKKDASGGVTHGNMEAVRCVTNENATARQMYWVDERGNEMGSMTVKILVDDDGNIIGGCIQPLDEQGNPIYVGTPTRQDTPNPGRGDNPDPNPDPDPNPNPNPETPKPKDADNLKRIDKNIQEDIAKDTGTKKVEVHQEKAKESEKTSKPSSDSYKGTEAKTQQNEASKKAEPVQQSVSKENNYSEDKGGSNSKEYAPVKENKPAQQQADKQEVKKSEAPKTVEQAQDTLKDLGIE